MTHWTLKWLLFLERSRKEIKKALNFLHCIESRRSRMFRRVFYRVDYEMFLEPPFKAESSITLGALELFFLDEDRKVTKGDEGDKMFKRSAI